jgi:hypothetical protein
MKRQDTRKSFAWLVFGLAGPLVFLNTAIGTGKHGEGSERPREPIERLDRIGEAFTGISGSSGNPRSRAWSYHEYGRFWYPDPAAQLVEAMSIGLEDALEAADGPEDRRGIISKWLALIDASRTEVLKHRQQHIALREQNLRLQETVVVLRQENLRLQLEINEMRAELSKLREAVEQLQSEKSESAPDVEGGA